LRRRNDFPTTVCISAWNQIRNTTVGPVMFTVEQCLAKAVELEGRTAELYSSCVLDEFAALALQWRRLAARAEIQDLRTGAIARRGQATGVPGAEGSG
jgi:hypothetical protein